ncbi:EpsG family protein [Amniculibacterium aquaticum]|uniref:EpsG family protein n=1 Tax=Amniculibacterium aquaticum TaxID=2479858 RepID=UPI000F5AC678|nr:EpsG family protein [Amniculibacterium aquaticum]
MHKKVHSSFGYITFLFLPILSLIIAINNYREKWAKNVVCAFTAFYAYHFSAPNEGADINAYINKFNSYTDQVYSIPEFIRSLYSEGSTTLDVIEPLTSYLVSQTTRDYHYLLLMYGILFGFFFSRNIWFFIDKTKGKISLQALAILILLIVQIGIWNINGMRFWCAAHIFIYATFNLLVLKKIKGYLFLIMACFMHLGLLLPVLIVFLFKSIKIPLYPLFLFFLFTFFLAELDMEVVRTSINNYAPSFLSSKLNSYTSEAYVEVVNERLDDYSIYYQISKTVRIGIILFFTNILYINKQEFNKDIMFRLFLFYLLLGSFANILSQMPSGGRYLVIADFILYGVMFYFVQEYKKFKFSNYIIYTVPIILIYTFYNFRVIGIHTFNIHHFINNPIVSLFIY